MGGREMIRKIKEGKRISIIVDTEELEILDKLRDGLIGGEKVTRSEAVRSAILMTDRDEPTSKIWTELWGLYVRLKQEKVKLYNMRMIYLDEQRKTLITLKEEGKGDVVFIKKVDAVLSRWNAHGQRWELELRRKEEPEGVLEVMPEREEELAMYG